MIEPKKLEPGSELHFALLGTPMGWNFLTGKDYADMQAFAKAVWDAATERAAKLCEEAEIVEIVDGQDRMFNFAVRHCAAAIRATGGEGS